MRPSHSLLALACALGLAACQPQAETPVPTAAPDPAPAPAPMPEPVPAMVDASQEMRQRLETVAAGEHRKDTDRARDRYRNPVETLLFFGLKPDSTVVEITPGGGWYSDILAPFLRPHGTYIGAIWDDTLPDQPAYYARLNTTLSEKIAAAPEVYGEPTLLRFNPQAPAFGEPASADMVLTFRNAHNWIGAGTAEAYFSAFFDVLKPGGVLGFTDHRAKGDTPTDGKSGYVTEQQIIDLATAAGFQLAERQRRPPARRLDPAAEPGAGRRGPGKVPGHRRIGPDDVEVRQTLMSSNPDGSRS